MKKIGFFLAAAAWSFSLAACKDSEKAGRSFNGMKWGSISTTFPAKSSG